MPLGRDIRLARRVLGNLVSSRRQRARVARRRPSNPTPAIGTVQIGVYFADADVNLYQLRQWYAPLQELAATWPVAIISRSPSTVLTLWDESPVPAVYLRTVAELEQFVHEQDLRIIFYVNQNSRNFQMFRYGRMWHVFINHGESDKMYMTTNQYKAYDYSFVAGEAALERLRRKLWDFDLDKRAITIGRPQTDHLGGALPYTPDSRTVVLYAPTWEGDRSGAAYGSIVSHGGALVDALLASERYRVIYRPHPRSGVLDPVYRAANRSIITAIERANTANRSAQHVYDDGPDLGWQLVAADVAITDVSAMVYDRLATGRPLLVTRPVSEHAEIDETGYLGSAEWLTAADAVDAASIVDRIQVDQAASERLHFWVERHFGDTTPGESTRRFHAAITELMSRWEQFHQLHSGDPDDDEFGESPADYEESD